MGGSKLWAFEAFKRMSCRAHLDSGSRETASFLVQEQKSRPSMIASAASF